uniref:Uncharacterized protein n=1 Tax=Lepeophtheirus salmonis TaxID=72036 RepID=A0A0K2TJ23_LEPSM
MEEKRKERKLEEGVELKKCKSKFILRIKSRIWDPLRGFPVNVIQEYPRTSTNCDRWKPYEFILYKCIWIKR